MCEGEEAIIIDNDSNAILYVSSDAYTLKGNLNVKEHIPSQAGQLQRSFHDESLWNDDLSDANFEQRSRELEVSECTVHRFGPSSSCGIKTFKGLIERRITGQIHVSELVIIYKDCLTSRTFP